MKELRQLVRQMRDWTETRGPAPAHKVQEWADAITAACAPVAWGACRELTLEELRAEKALFKIYARTPGRANTPFSAWKARATIAANHVDVCSPTRDEALARSTGALSEAGKGEEVMRLKRENREAVIEKAKSLGLSVAEIEALKS